MQLRLKIATGVPESEFDKHIEEELARFSKNIVTLFARGLEFEDNFNAQILSHTSNGSADTEDAIAHTLKRIPIGFLIFHQDKAGSLYQGPTTGTNWTISNIYLKCDVATVTFKVMIF